MPITEQQLLHILPNAGPRAGAGLASSGCCAQNTG